MTEKISPMKIWCSYCKVWHPFPELKALPLATEIMFVCPAPGGSALALMPKA
jgi:hypothetical protein